HIKLCERITSDGAERAHVCVTNTVKKLHYPSRYSPGHDLLEIHATGFAFSARARADHEVVRSAHDRSHHLWYERWNVAAIAIENHNDVTFGRNRAGPCRARPPVTAQRSYDVRAGFTRSLGCAIGAAVINDDHFAGHAGREAFANHAGDRLLLV